MAPLAELAIAAQDLWPFVLVPVALVVALLGTRRTTPPLSPGRRGLLVAFRTAAYTLLLVILASPVLNRTRHESQRPRVRVLVDESASMESRDAPGNATRLDQARSALRALESTLAGSGVDVDVMPFAAAPGAALAPEAYLGTPARADGAGTDVLGALGGAAAGLAGENLAAFVVLTDGRATRGSVDPGTATGLGAPVFAIGFGDTLPAPDLAVAQCDYNPLAYVESEALLDVRLENVGFRGSRTTLRLVRDGAEIFRQRIVFDQERGRAAVAIPLRFTTHGRQRLHLELDPLPGEATVRNNARELVVEVLKSRIRALVVAARPDWDVAALVRTLRVDPNVRVTVAQQDATGGWIDTGTGQRFAWPRGAAWAQDWDLFILAAPGRELGGEEGRALVAAVERGKGLLVLGGRESLLGVPGPLADALPVAVRARPPAYGPFTLRLTPQGRAHPISSPWMAVATDAGELDALAPLLAVRRDVALRPGAQVLLAADADPAVPFLVAGRCGDGETAVLNGFPFWRWGLDARPAIREAYGTFVGNLVRGLTQPRDVRPVQLVLPKPVFESGEGIALRALVLDAQLVPLAGAEVRVDVTHPEEPGRAVGTVLLQGRPARDGEYEGTVPGLGPGEYEARVTATLEGRTLGEDRTRFTVDAYSAEYADASQDAEFLRDLAARTGGRYVRPQDAAALAARLPRPERRRVLQSEIEIWDTAPLFLLFVGVLGAEWLLRKRFGLL